MPTATLLYVGDDDEKRRNVLGRKVQYLRERMAPKVTREEMARRIGLTGNGLYFIESGKRRPKPATVEALARELGTTIADLHTEPPLVAGEPESPSYAPLIPEALQELLLSGDADPPPSALELRQLLAYKARGRPTPETYLLLLRALRSERAAED